MPLLAPNGGPVPSAAVLANKGRSLDPLRILPLDHRPEFGSRRRALDLEDETTAPSP